MQTEVNTERQSARGADTQDVSTCPNCCALMPREMRFCRACGCRLGEGVEEYTETVRFQNVPPTSRSRRSQTASAAPSQTSPTGLKDWGAMARNVREQARRSATVGLNQWRVGRTCRRVPRWMIWVFLPMIVFSIIRGPISNSISRHRGSSATANAQTSDIGVEFNYANGGAFIKEVTTPGSPADQAGLVGGDVITSFDGKPISKETQLTDLLAQTPIGKSVDVIYVRDGETKTTKLTTVSGKDIDRLENAFEKRSEGEGKFGLKDDGDAEAVPVPGTNINGVRLGDLSENLPADIAGVHKGDIVIQMNETPIRTVKEFINRIHRAAPYSTVNLVVMRDGNRLNIPIKFGKR